MGHLNRLAVGKELYIDLVGDEHGTVASIKCDHPSIGREGRRDRGIREAGDLGVRDRLLRAWPPHDPKEKTGACQGRQKDRNAQDSPIGPVRGRRRQHGRRLAGVARKLHGRRGHRRNENIPAPGHRADQLLSIVVERAPDLQNALGQRIVGDRNIPPYPVDQFGLGGQPATPLDQIGQDLERFGPQRDLFAAAPERATFQVHFVLAEPVPAARVAREWFCLAQPVPPL